MWYSIFYLLLDRVIWEDMDLTSPRICTNKRDWLVGFDRLYVPYNLGYIYGLPKGHNMYKVYSPGQTNFYFLCLG